MFFNRKNKQQQTVNQANNKPIIHNMPVYMMPDADVYTPFLTLAKNNHLLIAGCTGSGKSVLVNGIIISLLMTKSPYDAQFIFIDPKMVELNQYKNLPHTVKYASEKDDMLLALKMAEVEMDRRYKIMQANNEKQFSGSDLYVIIDELADLMVTDKSRCFPIMQRLAQLGRSAKIHCIFNSQSILAKIIPSELKCNFPVVIGLRTATAQQSRYLIQSPGCETLPDPKTTGTGKALIRDGADLFPLDIYKYPDNEISRIITHWTAQNRN